MPAPLNVNPRAHIPMHVREKTQLEAGQGGFPNGMRRMYAVIKRCRPSRNPSFVHAVTKTVGDRHLNNTLAKALDSVVEAIFFNHCYVTGLVLVRSELQLAICAGLATYHGKIVVTQKHYEALKEAGVSLDDYISQHAIPSEEYPNIGRGRVARVLRLLRDATGMVEYLEAPLRGEDKQFIPRQLWLTDKFWETLGMKEDDQFRRERAYLMKAKKFLDIHRIKNEDGKAPVQIPQSVVEAKRMIQLVVRERRKQHYLQQRKARRLKRHNKRVEAMNDQELRNYVTRKCHKELAGTEFFPETPEEFHKMVEYQMATIRKQIHSPPLEPKQSAAYYLN